ncbi:Uncharacterised protein [Streptococcus suis]|uniref:Uncharacterized protein n=1 Tax=Streptococcus suis TaxID=1307 RepID=A0A0Z8A5P2_STRSU|nr:Uncharacterised protein [Streptococcus suis]CYV07792.1 Uncharacterised protein [Streptococcus suis]
MVKVGKYGLNASVRMLQIFLNYLPNEHGKGGAIWNAIAEVGFYQGTR